MKSNLKSLLFHILVPNMLAFTIQMLIPDYQDYLNSLNQPFVLPSLVFIIVWPCLYTLMGISAFLVEKENSDNVSHVMKYYYIQLFINLSYSVCFFYFHNLVLSTIITISLLVLSIITFIKFYKFNKLSAYLLIPYILWLIIANYLQIGIYFLNN